MLKDQQHGTAKSDHDHSELAFIYAMKSLKFLVEVNVSNAQSMSSAGIVLYILTHFRSVLVRERAARSKRYAPY